MSHEPGEPLTFQEPDHYSAPAAWAEVKAALREAEEQPSPPTHAVTSSEIALARMLVAYDAWEPEDGDYEEADAPLDAIGDVLVRYDLLAINGSGIYAPNTVVLALIDRVRKAGLL